MKDHNVIVDKSFAFAVRIVKLSQYLKEEHKEYILSKQVLRSGTSIGANVNEAQAAQSKKDADQHACRALRVSCRRAVKQLEE